MNKIAKPRYLSKLHDANARDNISICFFYLGINMSAKDFDKLRGVNSDLSEMYAISSAGMFFDLNSRALNMIHKNEIMLMYSLSNRQLLLVLEHTVVKYDFANGFEMKNFINLVRTDWIIADEHTYLNVDSLHDIERSIEQELFVRFKNQMVLKFRQLQIPANFLKPTKTFIEATRNMKRLNLHYNFKL